ncbi:MAG: nuclear transport factor 2 family protein [Pseudonocardiales bacterium]|nr:nuclear transport factor 2 family protein [Pseudonocardiales bacterium]
MADNVAIVKSTYEAPAKGDIVTFLDTLDEQVEWHLPEHHPLWSGKAFVGPQAVLEGHLARVAEIYDGFRIDPQRVTALGDTVLVEMRCRGRGKVTGQDLDVQAAQIWDLRDGKCVRWQEYLDIWQLTREMIPT